MTEHGAEDAADEGCWAVESEVCTRVGKHVPDPFLEAEGHLTTLSVSLYATIPTKRTFKCHWFKRLRVWQTISTQHCYYVLYKFHDYSYDFHFAYSIMHHDHVN